MKTGKISNFAKLIAIQVVLLLIGSNAAGFIGASIVHAIGTKRIEQVKQATKLKPAEQAYFKLSKDYPSYGLFFKEFTNIQNYPYRSHIGWRLEKFHSRILNTNEAGIRKTPILSPIQSSERVWMIGGSALWGYTVADNETIPAYFQKLTSTNVTNLGEQAYTSRQSLNLLLNELVKARLDGSSPTLVIAYEGVNDSIFPCLTEANHPFVHSREGQIQSALIAAKSENTHHRSQFLGTAYRTLLPGILQFRSELTTLKSTYIPSRTKVTNERCLAEEYAQKVAFNAVQNWELTHALLDSIDIKYYAVLQPNPYTDVGYKGDNQADYKTFITRVYPLIQQYAKGKSWFIDGSNWFVDYDKPAWVDSCCHANPDANKFIAEQIVKQLSLRQGI